MFLYNICSVYIYSKHVQYISPPHLEQTFLEQTAFNPPWTYNVNTTMKTIIVIIIIINKRMAVIKKKNCLYFYVTI